MQPLKFRNGYVVSSPFYWECNYLSNLGFKLNHVSKRGHVSCVEFTPIRQDYFTGIHIVVLVAVMQHWEYGYVAYIKPAATKRHALWTRPYDRLRTNVGDSLQNKFARLFLPAASNTYFISIPFMMITIEIYNKEVVFIWNAMKWHPNISNMAGSQENINDF